MSHGYLTIPRDTNDQYQKLRLGEPTEFVFTVHTEPIMAGKGFWFEAICSTNASVETSVSVMSDIPWDMHTSIRNGWPIINPNDIWSPCTEIPNFSLTAGKIYRLISTECILPYRRIRMIVTPSTPTDEKAKGLDHAAIRMDLALL